MKRLCFHSLSLGCILPLIAPALPSAWAQTGAEQPMGIWLQFPATGSMEKKLADRMEARQEVLKLLQGRFQVEIWYADDSREKEQATHYAGTAAPMPSNIRMAIIARLKKRWGEDAVYVEPVDRKRPKPSWMPSLTPERPSKPPIGESAAKSLDGFVNQPAIQALTTGKQAAQSAFYDRSQSAKYPVAVVPNPSAGLHPSVVRWATKVDAKVRKHGLDTDFQVFNIDASKLVLSVMQKESDGNPKLRSKKQAKGLLQLIPKTSKYLHVRNPYDPDQNIDGGVRYLKQLLAQFGDPVPAIAAFNAGPTNVKKNDSQIPNFPETKKYVRVVFQYYHEAGGRNVEISSYMPASPN